jgi:hypothetical protein
MNVVASKRPSSVGVLTGRIEACLAAREFEQLADLYAEDALLEEVSATHPPSHPLVARGRAAILERMQRELLRDPVSGWGRRLGRIEVVDAVETASSLAYVERWTFVAGDTVVAHHLARLHAGRIVHDRVLCAWDGAEPG